MAAPAPAPPHALTGRTGPRGRVRRWPVDPEYAGYRLGSLAARALPGSAVEVVARSAGRVGPRVMGGRRRVVERNLARVRGGIDAEGLRRSVVETFASYGRYWIESFRLPGTAAADLERGMSTEGFEHVESALAAGGGVILALPHLGGWEWAAFWLAEVKGLPVTAVVEPVEPPELAEWFVALRRSIGINVVPLGPSAGTDVIRALRDNHIVCLLCDRDIGGGGIEVDFFGESTTLPAGPATIALRTGVPICPTAVYFEGPRHHGVIRPPLPADRTGRLRQDVTRLTGALAAELEWLIRRAPEQWHLMQPNWPSDREALRKATSEG